MDQAPWLNLPSLDSKMHEGIVYRCVGLFCLPLLQLLSGQLYWIDSRNEARI